jgi:F-type H+-transporting ATPase subunit b
MSVFRGLHRLSFSSLTAGSWLVAESASAAGGEGEKANILAFEPDLAVVTAIVFLVLLAILWKFAWGPIMDGLKKREDSIAEEIASAERSNEKAQQLLGDYEARLSTAAEEVRSLIEQGRRDAESQKQQILTEAQKAARAERDRALREISVAKNEAMAELAQQSVDAAVDLAGRIVGKQLDTADHSRLIAEALDKFPSQN